MSSEAAMAEQFRMSRGEEQEADEIEPTETQENYREEIRAAKMAKEKREVAKSSSSESTSMAKVATNRFLAFCWLSLIPSFGLSLLYINLHVFMHQLFPSLFGKLGEEWVPTEVTGVSEATKSASKKLGLIETMLLIAIDLGVILLLFAMAGTLFMIIDYASTILGKIFIWMQAW